MVPLTDLWLPILLSAVFVFILSSIVHMVLPHHRTDYAKVPREDEVMTALRPFNIPAGDYLMPRPDSPSAMSSPEYIAKRDKGPVAIFTIFPSGPAGMGQALVLWFVYCVAVGIFAGYVTGRAFGPGTDYMTVFRFAGTTAFACYTMALWQHSIWYRRKWSTTIKSSIDGLVYALLTAGTFGWLWPR